MLDLITGWLIGLGVAVVLEWVNSYAFAWAMVVLVVAYWVF